eukprot:19860-Heterococcus_DN1.PRE.9
MLKLAYAIISMHDKQLLRGTHDNNAVAAPGTHTKLPYDASLERLKVCGVLQRFCKSWRRSLTLSMLQESLVSTLRCVSQL